MAGDNVKITKATSPKIVPMYNMKHGQFGVVIDPSYTGAIVKAYNHPSLPKTIHVWGLGDDIRIA